MNMTYWKKFEANISITTSTAYYILENGTYVENYTYVITNNENTHLTIGSLDLRPTWVGEQRLITIAIRVCYNGTDLYAEYIVY